MIMLLTRRWSLPFGALTLLIVLNSALMSVFHDSYHLLPAALGGGVLADVLASWLRPSAEPQRRLRLYAFAVPAAFYGLYFAALWLTSGIEWTVHLWMGAIVLAGAVGLFVSFLVVSPFDSRESIADHRNGGGRDIASGACPCAAGTLSSAKLC